MLRSNTKADALPESSRSTSSSTGSSMMMGGGASDDSYAAPDRPPLLARTKSQPILSPQGWSKLTGCAGVLIMVYFFFVPKQQNPAAAGGRTGEQLSSEELKSVFKAQGWLEGDSLPEQDCCTCAEGVEVPYWVYAQPKKTVFPGELSNEEQTELRQQQNQADEAAVHRVLLKNSRIRLPHLREHPVHPNQTHSPAPSGAHRHRRRGQPTYALDPSPVCLSDGYSRDNRCDAGDAMIMPCLPPGLFYNDTETAAAVRRQRKMAIGRPAALAIGKPTSLGDSEELPANVSNFKPPPWTVLLGLHHKTGTALVDGIYSTLADMVDLEMVKAHFPEIVNTKKYTKRELQSAHIVVDWHFGCHLPPWFGGACSSLTDTFPVYRLVHLVRDPVEVVISGYLYHKNGPGDEEWLRRPDPELPGGVSYYDFLNNVSDVEGIKAEAVKARWEIDMYATAYTEVEKDPRAINVRLEQFQTDFRRTASEVLDFTGFSPRAYPQFLQKAEYWNINNWSPKWRQSEHLTSTFLNVDRDTLRAVFVKDTELNGTFTQLRRIMGYE